MSKGDAVDYVAGLGVDELELDVLLFAADNLGSTEVVDIVGGKDRFLVAWSEGGETLQVMVKTLVDVVKVYEGIDVHCRFCLLRVYVVGNVLLHTLFELVNVFPAYGESAGIGVSAEVDQKVATTFYCAIYVEACNGTCRPCSEVALSGKDDGRTVVNLGKSGSHDTDDPLVPRLVIEDDALRVVLCLVDAFYDVVCLLGHLLVDVLALLVVCIYFIGIIQGDRIVSLHQEVDGASSILHSTGSVDARPYLEHYVGHGNFTLAKSADVQNGLHADGWMLVQLLESMVGEDTVFFCHFHKVCSYGYGAEVE